MKPKILIALLGLCLPLAILAQDEPDIDEFIFVDQEPRPLNLNEVRQLIQYPAEAVEQGLEGTVVVRVLVDTAGNYVKHQLVKSVAPVLDAAVIAAVDQLNFTPAIRNGQPVTYWFNVPFPFRLVDEREEELKGRIAALTEQLESNREDYVVWQRRGVLRNELGQFDKAVVDFTESIAVNPKKNKKRKPESYAYLFYAYYSRGIAYAQQEAYEEALEDFGRAIEVATEMKGEDSTVLATLNQAILERGYVYALDEQYDLARLDLKRVLEITDSLDCQVYPLLIDIALAQDDYAELAESYSGLIDCKPEEWNLYYSRGFYRSQVGQYVGAVEDMKTVLEHSQSLPLKVAAHNRIAFCYLQVEEWKEAEQAIREALDLNAVNQLSHYYLGLVLEGKGKPDEACASVRKALYFGLEGPEGEAAITFLDERCGGWDE